MVFRTPDATTNSTFAGKSLTLGIVGGLAGWCTHKTGVGTVTYPDLRLANGRIADGQNGSAWMAGMFSVQAPEAAPFRLTGSQDRTFTVIGPISGDVGTGLQISRTEGETGGSFLCRIWGTNTMYKGKWVIDGANIMGEFKPWALGDTPDTMTADAITLRNSGQLSGNSGSVLAPVNRGVTVETTGGGLYAYTAQSWTLDMPVTGAGTVTVSGLGKLIFKNTWTAGDIIIASGAGFGVLTNATMAESISITANGQLGITDTHTGSRLITVNAGGEITPSGFANIGSTTMSNIVFNGGGIALDVNLDTGASDCLNLRGNSAVNVWPLPIRLGVPVLYTAANNISRWPVLTIPTSIKTVTTADFTNTTVFASYAPVKMGFQIETSEDGIQTVYVTRESSLITVATSNLPYNDSKCWSDGKTAHAGALYLNRGGTIIRTIQQDNTANTFPGDGLILSGTSDDASSPSRAALYIKCQSFTCTNLILMGSSIVVGGGGNGVQSLNGMITVTDDTAPGNRVNISDENSRTLIVNSELRGKGFLRFTSLGATKSYFGLTSLNTNYVGYIQIAGYLKTFAVSTFPTLTISDEQNLGANPYAFLPNALDFWNMGKLMVTNDVIIDDSNRGVCIDTNGGQIEVGTNATLTVIEPFVFNGNLTKLGAGTLAIGNANRTSNGKTMYVSAGAFQPLVTEPVGNLNLNFASGARLRIAKQPDDDALAEYGLVDAGDFVIADALAVEIDYGSENPSALERNFSMPVCTVSADTADVLRGKIFIVNPPPSFAVSISEDAPTYGNSTGYVRFIAVLKSAKGSVVFLR